MDYHFKNQKAEELNLQKRRLIFKCVSPPLQAQAPQRLPAGGEIVHICRFQHWRRQADAEQVWFGDQPQQLHQHAAQVERSTHQQILRLAGRCCRRRHPPILQRHEEEDGQGRTQTVGD